MSINSLFKFSFVLSLLLLVQTISGQEEVRFMTGGLDAVRSIAKEKNKNLLIDTYASWCIPCKRMDKVFKNKRVSDFFNANYISYKVNMDGPYGDAVGMEYQVVFLPTLIIVGPDGTVKYKVDREMSADELLSVGQLAMQEGIQIASDATAIRINGEPAPTTTYKAPPKRTPTNTQKKGDDKIVYILGLEGGSKTGDYLKKEAYFRLELMDGTHAATAQKYLDTQSDWNTIENMRFILDFVERPWSPSYNHIIANKQNYYEKFPKDQVDNTLQILVYRHLYKGIPRPSMADAIQLYTELEYKSPEHNAQKYFIIRSKINRNHKQAFEMSYEYVTKMNSADLKSLVTFLDYTIDNSHLFSQDELLKVAMLVSDADISDVERLSCQPKAIKLLVKADNCKKAKKLLKHTEKLVIESKKELPELKSISIDCDV